MRKVIVVESVAFAPTSKVVPAPPMVLVRFAEDEELSVILTFKGRSAWF